MTSNAGEDESASAKLMPSEDKKPIRLGWLKCQLPDVGLDSRFFDPLPEDELRLWNGEGE